MGSVIDLIDCPNCGQEAVRDYYYKTGDDYIHCSHCGYFKKTENDEVFELSNPFGSFRIKGLDDIAFQVGTIETEEDYEIIKKKVLDDEQNIEYCSISRFVNGEIQVEELINKNK